MTRLMVKDLGLAMALVEHAHSAVPMGALARNLFNLHASQGRENKDFPVFSSSIGTNCSAGLRAAICLLPDSL